MRYQVKIPKMKLNKCEAVKIVEVEASSAQKAITQAQGIWDFPIRVKNPHKKRKIMVKKISRGK